MFFSSTLVAIRGLSVPDFQPRDTIGEKEFEVSDSQQTIDKYMKDWIQHNQEEVDIISYSLKGSYDTVYISAIMALFGGIGIGIYFFAAYQFVIIINLVVSMFMIGVILQRRRGELEMPDRAKGEYIPPGDIWIGMKSSFYPSEGVLAKTRRRLFAGIAVVLFILSFILIFITPV